MITPKPIVNKRIPITYRLIFYSLDLLLATTSTNTAMIRFKIVMEPIATKL